MNRNATISETISRWQRCALLVAVVAALLAALGYWWNHERFHQAYLVSYLYCWTAAMGCLGLALIHQMTSGKWGDAGKPFIDAGTATLPLLAIAFVPIGWGLEALYPWTDAELFRGDPHAAARAWYLSEPFFLARAVGYVLTAGLLGAIVSLRPISRGKWPTGAGLATVLATLLATFAAFDWGMSLDPYWYSTMYGAIFIAGGILTGMCLVTAATSLAVGRLNHTEERLLTVMNDQANLILAFFMVWAYFALSQLLIIYAGNLPVEVQWYLPRLGGGWQYLAIALVVFHFFVPFLLLLSRDLKRDPRKLAAVALSLAAIHLLETFWVVMPSFSRSAFSLHWIDLCVPLALGSLFLFEFLRRLRPRLANALEQAPWSNATTAEVTT